ncbi:predicted protein [Phaeodactylum tricornutum CCAP 1055/1]|jgi:hypothetical protein|uniref:TLC domain-containing protein n=2 Tax=Phaeodactylum tricornutum TaxID=2850 RepID=B7FZ81_PHATC|nr:predicted protein [Phaeodactylum tricornutum CCAP 1055/1]EEC48296.1 predicted protein [Phaeodactylum tricornutum CCAP 1055/1]|eukprot:XP_002180105.1 predicted protein [Phaeodactylum tricornutum CCAP 1055/1]
MCKSDATTITRKPLQFLFSLDSFSSKDGYPPSYMSFALTCALVVGFLVGTELIAREILFSFKESHPLLAVEVNRLILARHIGVDTLSCGICAWLGWNARHLCSGIFSAVRGDTSHVPVAAFDARMFTYHPAGFRISLFFFAYQIKNLYDTIAWNDGPEFIFHHIFSLITAWGALYPSSGHIYTIFFFGLSEISTAVLCLLANFDDIHGVPGLGEAFPIIKVAVGAAFVVLFILCRCILWPIFSYYFCRDVLTALRATPNDPRTNARRGWLKFFLVALSGLSVLQVAWLGQIFVIAQEELGKAGFL